MGRAYFLVGIVCLGWVAACSSDRPVHVESTAAHGQALGAQVWAESQLITASDSQLTDGFGTAIAMSATTALVGAQGHDSATGAAYVLVRSGASWVEQQKLGADSGAPGDSFGAAVALDGDTALATTTAQGTPSYVFVRSGTTWTEQQKLLPDDGAPGNTFGLSAAVSGDTALVGATQRISPTAPGAAYAFVRSGTTWTQQQKLVPDDSADGDGFGIALAVEGDTALVGGWTDYLHSGAVYVFTRSGSVWSQQQKLGASDSSTDDEFGSAIAIDGDTALVGAKSVAYVLVRSGTTWSEQTELQAQQMYSALGPSVAVAGDTALVRGKLGSAGAAFMFERSGTTWSESPVLQPVESDIIGFGLNVALQPGLALVRGTRNEGNTPRGVVVGFDLGAPDGEACTSNADCATTHCVDGVCCDTACTGACAACTSARTGATDGTCSSVAKGSPGSPSCAPDTCNGENQNCPCHGDSDCAAGLACVVSTGNCVPPGTLGAPCATPSTCSTGYCVDGVCCNAACTGACETCSRANGASSDGTCSPLPAGSVGGGTCGRYRCDGTSGQCPTSCTNDSGCASGYACSPQRQCIRPGGECSNDLTQSIGLGGITSCAPYTCNRNTGQCRFTCADDTECAAAYFCNNEFVCQRRSADGGVDAGGPGYAYTGNAPHFNRGCGCRAAGRHSRGDAPFVLALGLLLLAVRRLDATRP